MAALTPVGSDATGSDDGHVVAHCGAASQNIDIGQGLGVVDSIQSNRPRMDTCGENDLVVLTGEECFVIDRMIQV